MANKPFSAFRVACQSGGFRIIAACLAITCLCSCKRVTSAGAKPGSGGNSIEGANDAAWPPLKPRLLQRACDGVAIVAVQDEEPRAGLLLECSPAGEGARNWLIVCDVPSDVKSVPVACRRNGGLTIGFARPVSKLPSGLSLLAFVPLESPVIGEPAADPGGKGVHAVRFELAESLEGPALDALKTELKSVQAEVSALNDKIVAARDAISARDQTSNPPGRGENPLAALNELQQGSMDAIRRRNRVEAKVKLPFKNISGQEVAAAENPGALESAGKSLENTLLVSDDGKLLAFRWHDEWVTLGSVRSMVASEGGKVDSAEIYIGNSDSGWVQANCKLKLVSGLPGGVFTLMAATDSDLEQMAGGGTLDERLTRAERVPMKATGASIVGTKKVSANSSGSSRLWLRVFSDKATAPVIDELIVLNSPPGSQEVVPTWGKPPSPLFKLPPTPPDTPADVLKESRSIAASSRILDLIPAGDGATLMVQTDRAPFWAALDLQSGKWLDVPWKATAETLLASRAGKIHLLNKLTGGIETWDVAGGRHESTKLLQVELPITAIAGPLSSGTQPLIIADAKGIRFLDPADFHAVDIGAESRQFFKSESLDRSSIWLRVSGDGTIYQMLGNAPNRDDWYMNGSFVVDSTWRNVPCGEIRGFVAAGGRRVGEYQLAVDQAGADMFVEIRNNGDRFPKQLRYVSIQSVDINEARKEIARIHSESLFAASISQGRSRVPKADRRIFLDSRLGVLVVPAGDKLEWTRIGLPDAGVNLPEFVFNGESVRIPLPPGSGHRMTAASNAKVTIENGYATWVAPVDGSSDANAFSLVWTGELGTEVSRDFKVRLLQRASPLELLSPDGSKTLMPHPRGLLAGSGRISAMAGSGEVVIRDDGSVWSLSDCQQLFKMREGGGYLGDAERAYACGNGQSLTAYDLHSGQMIGTVPLGGSITRVVTGMSSRNPILATETAGLNGMLLQIPRNLSRPMPAMTSASPLDAEMQARLLVPLLESNANGTLFWDKGILISSNSGKVAAKVYRYEEYRGTGGVPDATGRIIVDSNSMLYLGFTPPRQIKISELPGGENAKASLDESGSYLLLSSISPHGNMEMVSIRELAKPQVELLKIRQPVGTGGPLRIISATRTLCVADWEATRIYDLDIPKIAAQLGAHP